MAVYLRQEVKFVIQRFLNFLPILYSATTFTMAWRRT